MPNGVRHSDANRYGNDAMNAGGGAKGVEVAGDGKVAAGGCL